VNEAEFASFYGRYARPLRTYLLGITRDGALADDVLQEAFCKFIQTPPSSTREASRRVYLYRIATSLVHDHWRRAGRERFWQRLMGRETVPDTLQVSFDLSHDMAGLFQRLKPQNRMMLWLAYVEGYDHEEIAEILGLKAKSIKVLLFRVRKQFARLLQQNGYDPEKGF
jgi:RNA polymerase sigma-70 factor (ECF subfamily)